MIPQTFIEEVQSKIDIVELVSAYIPLKRAGRNFKALCPFHGEKTPSFIVSPQKQIFHCFGCGEGGGVYQFLTLIEKISFPEAVDMLAKRVGVEIPYDKERVPDKKALFYEIMKEAALFFSDNLKQNKSILDYLRERGIKEEAASKFCLGYAGKNNSLLSHMRRKGFTLDDLEKTSLITASNRGFRDLFYDRITFPIFDVRSRIVGFGARIYKDKSDSPKYINSLENPIYSKREHLFGLNFSKEDIAKENAAIVVEGYLDMIMPFMTGTKNVAASLGTALTYEQIRLVKRYASCVILMYDSDKAGENATLRSIDLLLEHGLKVEVAKLPPGGDPDSLIRKKGKDFFLGLLKERYDFFEYKMDVLKNIHDADSIGGKTKIAQEMLATIDKLDSEIGKYEYIRKLAMSLGVKEEIMIAEFQNNFPKKNNAYKKQGARADSNYRKYGEVGNDNSLVNNISLKFKDKFISITEKALIKFMLTNVKAFSLIKQNLKEEYFDSYIAQKTISFFFKNYTNETKLSASQLLGMIKDKEISSFVSEILMDEDIPLDKNVFKESLLKLRKKGNVQLKKVLKDSIKQAESNGDDQRLKELINEYSKIK